MKKLPPTGKTGKINYADSMESEQSDRSYIAGSLGAKPTVSGEISFYFSKPPNNHKPDTPIRLKFDPADTRTIAIVDLIFNRY